MYSFALAYPYSYSRCAALVKRLARRKGPEIPEEEQSESSERSREIIRAETLTKSVVKTSPITMVFHSALLAVTEATKMIECVLTAPILKRGN